ncbi:MAG: DsbA family protein [Planctomycetaceae bacterium]
MVKKALLIGVNRYQIPGAGQCGCINYVENINGVLTKFYGLVLATGCGCQDAVVEALFRAYFTDGRNISDRQTLIDVDAETGLERQVAEAMLNSEAGLEVIAEAGELPLRLCQNLF